MLSKVLDGCNAGEIALRLRASERDGAGGVYAKNCGQRNVGHVLLSLPRMEPKAMTDLRILPSGEQGRGMPQIRADQGGGESPVLHVAKRRNGGENRLIAKRGRKEAETAQPLRQGGNGRAW